MIIDGGKVAATGTPNDLKNRYANDFVRIYDCDPALPDLLRERGFLCKSAKNYTEIEVKDTDAAKRLLDEYGESIRDFEVIKGKMDNVFLNVTGKNLEE